MRIRTIKPEFWSSLTVASLTPAQRLTFIGLWNLADDEGRCAHEPRLIKAALWPLDDRVHASEVKKHVDAIAKAGLVTLYSVHGRSYLAVNGWKEHQSISKPTPSKLPPPPDSPPGVLPESSPEERKGTGKGTGKGTIAALTPQQVMFGEVCLGMGYDQNLGDEDAREIGGVAKALLSKNLEPAEFPAYVEWLTGPESPIVNGTRLTLHSLPKWVKDWRAKPRVVRKQSPSRRAELDDLIADLEVRGL